MMRVSKEEFIKESQNTLSEIYDMLQAVKSIKLDELDEENTALIMIDLINGFTREGALKSDRVEGILINIAELQQASLRRGIEILAFADSHGIDSPEFGAYPPHCLKGTSEEEIVRELQQVGGYQLIQKNSTNGFLEEEFQKWLSEKQGIVIFIIVGDCTDICILQFAVTLKTWFNKQNKKARVIVPIELVETYDLGIHNGNLVQLMALYNMTINGIEVVRNVEF